MAFFDWGDDLSIDDGGPIDADHKKLVDQLNRLHSANSQGRGSTVVGALLDELVRDTVEHIHSEERIMASLAYPGLAKHRQHHQKFIDELHGIQELYRAGGITVATRLSALLRDWLSIHIMRQDKEIARFLRQK